MNLLKRQRPGRLRRRRSRAVLAEVDPTKLDAAAQVAVTTLAAIEE